METNVREAVLYLNPLKTVVKTELIREDGTRLVKHIPSDALASELQAHVHLAPVRSGLLPPGCIALTAFQDGWDITLDCGLDHCTVWYHNTEFPDFPLPRILLRCQVKGDRISGFALGIADTGIITLDTQMYRCPFPNVNGFHLCTGSNQFTGYDTLWKLRSLPSRVISLPFGDDYYKPDCTKLDLSARDLFEHLKDKTPAYYYSDVLIPMGKTVTDFIGGAL